MKVAFFSAKPFEQNYFVCAETNKTQHAFCWFPDKLNKDTIFLAKGCQAIVAFVTDQLSENVLVGLKAEGVQYIALRSAGYDHVDLASAKRLGLHVAHVPDYSPHAIAEHTIALILALNRKLIHAHQHIHELNFSLNGLVGFNLYGKRVGIIGLGKIGLVVAKILQGLGCELLGYDPFPSETGIAYGVTYTDLSTLFETSDIITLHVPLTEETRYLIQAATLEKMKKGVMLINTSRGAVVDTAAVLVALKTVQVGYFGMDVYEKELGIFFEDLSSSVLQDDNLAKLMSFPNVLITGHQAFLTDTALANIAQTTLDNLTCWENGILPRATLV